MKRTDFPWVIPLIVCLLAFALTLTASAVELDFNENADEAYIETREGIYTVFPDYHPKIKADLTAGVDFGFSYSYVKNHDWININLFRAELLPEKNCGYLGTVGITLLLKGGDNSFEVRLVTADTSWDAPYAAFSGKVPGIDSLGDENWHKIAVGKASGVWSLTVDGVEVFDAVTEEQSGVIDDLIGGNGYVSFGSNSGKGSYQVGEGSVVDAILEEIRSRETEAPETDPPAVLTEPETETVSVTARPETDGAETAPPAVTEAKEPETKQADGRLWLYLGCGIVIAASVTVIVIARRRKQK